MKNATTVCDLAGKRCQACEGGTPPLAPEAIEQYLKELPDWQYRANDKCLEKTFAFKGYAKCIAFVNAIAWMAQHEAHHPDLTVSYNQCIVRFTTHAIGGVSENDVICAAKVDAIFSHRVF